ncbi:MAG: hypothetical protein ACLP01_04030 [Solirubrobacteraceae bacterium]
MQRDRPFALAVVVAALVFFVSSAAAAANGFEVTVRQSGGTTEARIVPGSSQVQWTAYLNGRNVTAAFGYVPPSGSTTIIGASDGVRFGANRLVIDAQYPSGLVTITRSFTVSRLLPVAGAGSNQMVLGPSTVPLSAASTLAKSGDSLSYRWVITLRPPHSKARLVNPTAEHPQLITDVPGTYVVRLEARERLQAARGASESPAAGDTVQVDQTILNFKRGVFVSATPSGITGQLDAHISGGPFAGNHRFGNTLSPNPPYSRSVTMFFDRTTGAALPYSHPSAYFTADGTGTSTATLSSALAEAQKEAGALGHTVGMLFFTASYTYFSQSMANFLTNTVKVTGLPPAGIHGPNFAFYAVPGVPGSEWLSQPLSPKQALFAGLLAPDNNGNLSFAPNDVPSMGKTSVTYATSPSGITVNGSTIASGADKPCASAGGGYEVRIVDAKTLLDVSDPDNGHTFWTNACDDNTGAVQAQAMHDFIQRAALSSGSARLVFIQGVGSPQHANMAGNLTNALLSVSHEIDQLGGSGEAFYDNPDADSGPSYALVGKNFVTNGAVGSSDSSQAEVTTAAPLPKKPPAALSGVLTRDQQWRFVVNISTVGADLTSSAGRAQLALLDASQWIDPNTMNATPFPGQGDTSYLKMLDYTARTPVYNFNDSSVDDLGSSLCYPMPLAPAGSSHTYLLDIRDLYCGGAKTGDTWATKAADLLGEVSVGTIPPPPGVTKAQYEADLTQLETEGTLVDNVNDVISTLTAPYGNAETAGELSLEDAVNKVNDAVAKARNEQAEQFAMSASTFSTESALSLFGDLFDVGELVVDGVTDGSFGTVLGLASAASSVAGEFTNTPEGTPVLGPFVPGTTVSTIRTQMVDNYRSFGTALDRVRDLIVSDWGRLQQTKGMVLEKNASTDLTQALEVSSNQFIWQTMMQSLFTPTELISTPYNPAPLDARNYRCPVWGQPPLFSDVGFTLYFWRPWGKQGTFSYSGDQPHAFDDRDNLAPLEGTYISADGGTAYVLSAGGQGYPYPSYTNDESFPFPNPYQIDDGYAFNAPPQNLPPGTFAPLFQTADADTLTGSTQGDAASPQGITKQLFFPQIIRAAEQAGKLQTLECVGPANDIYNGNGATGYSDATEDLNTVPVGQPVGP